MSKGAVVFALPEEDIAVYQTIVPIVKFQALCTMARVTRMFITMLAAGVVLSVINAPFCPASVAEPHYDCQLRALAKDYTSRVVLRGWDSGRAADYDREA